MTSLNLIPEELGTEIVSYLRITEQDSLLLVCRNMKKTVATYLHDYWINIPESFKFLASFRDPVWLEFGQPTLANTTKMFLCARKIRKSVTDALSRFWSPTSTWNVFMLENPKSAEDINLLSQIETDIATVKFHEATFPNIKINHDRSLCERHDRLSSCLSKKKCECGSAAEEIRKWRMENLELYQESVLLNTPESEDAINQEIVSQVTLFPSHAENVVDWSLAAKDFEDLLGYVIKFCDLQHLERFLNNYKDFILHSTENFPVPLFILSAQITNPRIVVALIEAFKFEKIPLEVLQQMLGPLCSTGKKEALRMILSESSFEQLIQIFKSADLQKLTAALCGLPRDESEMRSLLMYFAEKNYTNAILCLFQHDRSSELTVGDLEKALKISVKNGRATTFRTILSSPKAAEIDPEKLRAATYQLLQNETEGRISDELVMGTLLTSFAEDPLGADAIRHLFRHDRNSKLTADDLEKALEISAENGNTEVFRAICSFHRFSEIAPEKLKAALCKAPRNESAEIFKAAMNTLVFNEIEFRELEEILLIACSWTDRSEKQLDFLKDFLKKLKNRKDEEPNLWKWILIKATAALAENNSPYAYELALDFKLPVDQTITWLMQKYQKSGKETLERAIYCLQNLKAQLPRN